MQAKASQAPLVGGAIPGATKSLAQAAISSANPPPAVDLYATGAPTLAMAANSTGNTGGSQPHNNMMPYLTINFCIALQGIFPSQN